jgi:protein-S-isoprenylcysteine O-methyltransferase Ste14
MKQLKWIVEDTIIFANFLLIAAISVWTGSILLLVGLAAYAVVFYVYAANPEQPFHSDDRRGHQRSHRL